MASPTILALVLGCARAQLQSKAIPIAGYGEEREYSGMYAENSQESIFFPCGVPLAEDGWWLRFQPDVQADRVHYQYTGAGYPTSTHDIRIRARLSPPGRFGTGFHTRELVVSKLLKVTNPGGICAGYQRKPAVWKGAGPVHLGVRSAVSSDDGSRVAILDWLGEITIWDTSAGEMVRHFPSEQTWAREDGNRVALAFSPSNDRLAVAGSDGIVRVWRTLDGRLLWRFGNSVGIDTIGFPGKPKLSRGGSSAVASIAFSPDGKTLLTTVGVRAYVWSLESGRVVDTLARFADRRSGSPDLAVFLQNPSRIVASGPEAILRAYGPTGGLPLFAAELPTAGKLEIVSPDNLLIALRATSDSMLLWSVAAGKVTQKLVVPHFFWGGMAFSPDSKSIAIAGGSFAIYIFDTQTGAPIRSIHGLYHIARDLWFTPKGDSIVVSAAFDSSLYVIPLQKRPGSLLQRRR